MFSQVALVFASCITVTGCTNISASESQQRLTNTHSNGSSQQTIANKTIKEQDILISQSNFKESSNRKNSLLYNSHTLISGNYMLLKPASKVNSYGNPLYELELFANGQLIKTHKTVSGRFNTQNRDRNVAGTEAPLPNGRYSIAKHYIAGSNPEVGGRFLSISPQFRTGRSALGIHYDPSFEKSIKDDGTSGCIALTNRSELDEVLTFIQTYQPKFLDVQI